MTRLFSRGTAPAAALAAVAAALLAAVADGFLLHVLAQVLVLGTAAMSLDLLVGVGGMVSLGHAALFGSAAYAAALASGPLDGNLPLLLLLGICTGAAGGGLMGTLVCRASGVFLMVVTLLLGQVVFEAVQHWRAVTGGADGLRGFPALSLAGWRFTDVRALFLLAGALALAAYGVARSFVASPAGRALAGTRQQPVRMEALGYGNGRVRGGAMALAGAIAGAAGTLHPFLDRYVGPHSVHWSLSASLIVMLVLGGAGSLWGAFVGSAVLVSAQTFLSSVTDRWQLCVGVLFVLTVLVLPDGVAGLVRRPMHHRTGRA